LFWPYLDATPAVIRVAGGLGLAVTVVAGLAARNRLAVGLLLAALGIALVPGAQSDLGLVMGVRLIFIPFLLATTFLGVLAANASSRMRLTAVPVGVLLVTFVAVSADNLGRWTESGRFSARFAEQLLALHARARPDEVFLLVDAPLDRRGAPTFEYRVYHILRPPFTDHARPVMLHQAEAVREVIQMQPAGAEGRKPIRVLAWDPERGLIHAPVPAGRDEVILSWGRSALATWPAATAAGGVARRSPPIGIAALAIDRIEVTLDRPLTRPPILTVTTRIEPGPIRPAAVAEGSTWSFPLADHVFSSPADRVDRIDLLVAEAADWKRVRSIRLMRSAERFDLDASVEQSEAGLVLRLRVPEPDPRWQSFRLELFTQASPVAQFELGREAFTGSAKGGIEWRTTLDSSSLERVGIRSGALFFFRLDARREDGSGRARSRVAQVHVP
jgi:hypothetical protein